jgi:arylsulfatase A-like enzyme
MELNLSWYSERWLSRTIFILTAIVLLSAPRAAMAARQTAATSTKKPNIIFILADDLGYGDLGCYGQKRIKSPNLDRMAAEGMRFTQGYAGATVCAPSRCVLMTGLHIGHARIRGLDPPYLPGLYLIDSDITVAEVLRDAGYATGMIGKWGLGVIKAGSKGPEQGLPRRQGFDYFYGYLTHGHAHNYYPDFLWRNESKAPLANVLSNKPEYKGLVAEKKVDYAHDFLANDALKFIREHVDASLRDANASFGETRPQKDNPFFLYLCFTIPHANDEAGDKGMEVPELGDYANLDWPEPQKGHAAMITRMDRDVGRLFALLKELNIDDNTLVIFSSDNGPHKEGGCNPEFNDSNGPLRGMKGDLWEGGIRVPLIARWPGQIAANATSDSPVYFADVMPTLASLGGGKAPAKIDGIDFSPTLLGSNQPELANRFMYWEFDKDGLQKQAARWRNWKAVKAPHTKPIALFDLASDIGEEHDVAAAHPDIVAKFNKYIRTARTNSPDWPIPPQASRSNKKKNIPATL